MPYSRVTINGVDYINLENDTVTSSNDIAAGKYGHLNTGERVLGTGQIGGSSTLTTKTITSNGTYNASSDNADGYSSITVNVPNDSSTPSVTAHSIVFDLETGADVTISFYTDSTFILDAIRATTPTTYNDVTVESASLDNVAWYTKPIGTWVTLYSNDAVSFTPNGDDEPGSYCWISEMGETPFILGDTYRVTLDGSSAEVVAYNDAQYGVCIGHQDFSDSPIMMACQWGAWIGTIEEKKETNTTHSLKVEHFVLS